MEGILKLSKLQTDFNFFTMKNMTQMTITFRTTYFYLKFLHIAPEYCFLKIFKKMKNLDYLSADLNSPWADIKMDVHNIQFDDNSFDVVICNHVLEHVDDSR